MNVSKESKMKMGSPIFKHENYRRANDQNKG
jgi:hypothetical protein